MLQTLRQPNKDTSLVEKLIGYIYRVIDVSKFKYEMIEYEDDLKKFLSSAYYISLNISGKNCFLVFTKIGVKNFSFLVDRKQLSYSIKKICFNNVDIIECNADVDAQVYCGTIFDGIYVKNGNENKFIITDVYYFRGNDYTNMRLDMKLYEINHYLGSINEQRQTMQSNRKINLNIEINQIYNTNEIDHLVRNIIPKMNPKHVRGLCFYPEKSGIKLIFMFDNKNGTQNHSAPNQILSHRSDIKLTRSIFTAKGNDPIYAILEMKPTDTIDIYNLYAVEKLESSSGIKLRKKKMDIAYIPTTEKSDWCKKIISDSVYNSALVKCVWRNEKKKWEPLELNTKAKLPCSIDVIMKDLVEIEVSSSDSEAD